MTSLFPRNGVDKRGGSSSEAPPDVSHWKVRPAVWLLLLFAAALLIRFTHLDAKPAWMDEVATVIFSLGNSSRMVPLNDIVSLDEILRPLQVTPGSTAADAVTNLLAEDNHPPAYFALAHAWMAIFDHFFGRADGYASLRAARALSAIFGALGVPATYLLAWFSFRSRLIGILCAALMAVSPFGVFLAQEARHYTLAILMVVASLCCFVLAVQALRQRAAPSGWLVFAWVLINTLSIAVHYFSGVTILAEALVLLMLLIKQCREAVVTWRQAPWVRIYIAVAGTFVGAAVWLPILINFYGSPQSSFLRSGPASWQYWVNPVVQSAVGWLYTVLSPVTSGYSWQAVTAMVMTISLTLLLYVPWLMVQVTRSLTFQLHRPPLRTSLQ
ncbi:MAG: glycosyltransferase family 39 protein, partial [Phormidesmis sp.]